eukprot:1195067-Prorocentrum_minimum.AAC.2
MGSLTQMLDGPHYGEKNRAAADNVQQVENVTPGEPTLQSFPSPIAITWNSTGKATLNLHHKT